MAANVEQQRRQPQAMLEGSASGQTARVQLTAVNGAGETQPGDFP